MVEVPADLIYVCVKYDMFVFIKGNRCIMQTGRGQVTQVCQSVR